MHGELILVVEDDKAAARMLERELASQSLRIQIAHSGADAMRALEADVPALVLLDVVLPDVSGLELLRAIKAQHDVPVIVTTARIGDDVRREAFDLGADEFIAKPFSPLDVSESIRFLLSPGDGRERGPRTIRAGRVEIDVVSRRVMLGRCPVKLTRSEWLLLAQLARVPGEPRLHQELLASVWGSDYRDDLDYLRLVVQRLKRKLGDDADGPHAILDYHGVGYRLNAHPRPR